MIAACELEVHLRILGGEGRHRPVKFGAAEAFQIPDPQHLAIGLGGAGNLLAESIVVRHNQQAFLIEALSGGGKLKMKDGAVDYAEFSKMVAAFLESGFNYFDTAHGYVGGKSETALELMAEGKFRHFGISFHNTADVLEHILTEYPQIEVVQIQFNYVDYEDQAVESRKCYEVCQKFGKPVIVMEPVKGGNLANLPDEAGPCPRRS